MNALIQTWLAAANVVRDHSAGLFVLVLAVAALMHSAAGFGRARQWYVLPVVFGLTALFGFVLNPFADANTADDLRAKLTSYETLTLLCIVQFILLAASLALGLHLDDGHARPRGVVLLVAVHTLPAPMVVIAMLLVEQGWLANLPGARPETVGKNVGFVVAGALTMICCAAMIAPRRWLALPHHVLSIALLAACMFVPTLQDPLPRPLFDAEPASVHSLWVFALAGLVTLAGCLCPETTLLVRASLRTRSAATHGFGSGRILPCSITEPGLLRSKQRRSQDLKQTIRGVRWDS